MGVAYLGLNIFLQQPLMDSKFYRFYSQAVEDCTEELELEQGLIEWLRFDKWSC